MPNRIGFHVIYATSEVADHPASELGWAGPASRGWRSAPGARAPHDLVLQLAKRVAITRVQLLAHHYLIPKRIELLVHDSTGGEGVARTPSSPQYEAVGWVGLGEGEGGARELKTASVPPRPAAYIRLRLSEPHHNDKNCFNQVALMGVNVFGIDLESESDSKIDDSNSICYKKAEFVDNEGYSPYDDLSFIMYVDNEIANVMRQLESKKQYAIIAERFEYARKLKVACDILGAGGRVIGGWQLQKRIAAAAEQYERATRRRDAIAIARARLSDIVNLEILLEANGFDSRNDEYKGDDYQFTTEMLIQSTAHLSFDSPSPPTVMQPISNKQSTTDNHEINVQSKTKPSNVNREDIKNGDAANDNLFYSNSYNEPSNRKKSQDQINYANKVGNNTDTDSNRTMSPILNDNSYMDMMSNNKKYLITKSHESMHDLHMNSEKNNKIYFEDQVSLSKDVSNENLSDMSKKNNHIENYAKLKNDVSPHSIIKSTGNTNDTSYFNSPANSVSPTNLQYNVEVCRNGQSSPAASSRSSGQQKIANMNNTIATVKRRNRSAGPPPPAHHRSSYEAYEERLVPTLRHSHTNEYLRSYQTEQTDQQRGRSKLGEKDRKQAALPILIFGEELVEKIYSKHFAEKEEGLQYLKNDLRSFDSKPMGGVAGAAALSPNKTARAVALLLHRALRDPVFSVYSLAAELTRVFFTEFITGRVNTAEVSRSIERLVPELLTRAGDPAPRIHSLAMHTILTMADSPPVRSLNLIPAYLVRPLTAGTAPRLALSRLLMVEQLLFNHGIDKNSGLKARSIAELGAGGLTHGQGAVRRAAERLLLAAYEKAPRLVRGQLPPDDSVTRRNLIYRHLFEGFDRIDRKKQEKSLGVTNCNDTNNTQCESEPQSLLFESMTASQLTHSMSSSMGSSMTGSLCQPKSSIKKQVSKKYNTNVGFNGVKNDTEYPGYNKLRLDSAVSPKHQPKINKTALNPRNYVLEKNWQNSIQNNYCSQMDNKYHNMENANDITLDKKIMTNSAHNLTTTNFNKSPNKNTIVARNLHSSIIFDNKTSYSDGENTSAIENDVKHLTVGKKTSSDTIKPNSHSPLNGTNESPNNTLKKNKEVKNTIYRSKSGSNVPTCFDENNYDSFDDSQIELYDFSKGSRDDIKFIAEDIKENCNSGTSTPDICNKKKENKCDDNQCPFCLTNVAENALDAHYWRTCPLLCRCMACRAPLEIRALNQHLLEDCPHNNEYKQCSRCMEAVEIENYNRHLADNDCIEITENYWKCPLCHNNILGDDDNWRLHLSGNGDDACKMNSRILTK